MQKITLPLRQNWFAFGAVVRCFVQVISLTSSGSYPLATNFCGDSLLQLPLSGAWPSCPLGFMNAIRLCSNHQRRGACGHLIGPPTYLTPPAFRPNKPHSLESSQAVDLMHFVAGTWDEGRCDSIPFHYSPSCFGIGCSFHE